MRLSVSRIISDLHNYMVQHLRRQYPSLQGLSIYFIIFCTLTKRSESKSKLSEDRRSVCQSVWCQALMWGPRPDFFTVRHLRVCWCGAPSLTIGRVCRLQLLLDLASAVILGSESRVIRWQCFAVSDRRLPPPGGPDPRIYIHQD
jgi:hypothetical protein